MNNNGGQGIYIAVGSNIEPQNNIIAATDILKKEVAVIAVSRFYKTEPIGRPEQSYFLNGIIRIQTELNPRDLKYLCLRNIETKLGRHRTDDKYAARTIDLDLIIYHDFVINEPDLALPDPDIRTRNFIAVPLLQLNPNLILPDTNEPLTALPISVNIMGLEYLADFTAKLKHAAAIL